MGVGRWAAQAHARAQPPERHVLHGKHLVLEANHVVMVSVSAAVAAVVAVPAERLWLPAESQQTSFSLQLMLQSALAAVDSQPTGATCMASG